MRVFHFFNDRYGLDDILRRRLKVSTFKDLNDPFELFAANLGEPAVRRTFEQANREYATLVGLLCFSRDWHNPVLWSHYASGHTGLCLGFDLNDAHLRPVHYSRKRLNMQTSQPTSRGIIDNEFATLCMSTKYLHWRYENEVRSFVDLRGSDSDTDVHYATFSDDLRLATVIVGVRSQITRQVLTRALGDLAGQVEVFKARLAFRSFRVVKQNNPKLWL